MNKTICAITTLLVLNGCATPPVTVMQEKITGDNFWKMAKVERLDKFFYSGRYVGKLSVCFPPASKIACPDNEDGRPAYEAIDELPMVAYAAQIQNSDLSERTKAKEFLHLILSDIALVKGYKSFAILKKTESSSCRTSYSTDTYGSVSSIGQQSASGQYSGIGQYSGTSNFRESTSCGFIDSISVVMFNDIYVLEKGVFSKDRQYGGNHFGIERSLYVGNPGVAFGDHNKVNNTYGFFNLYTPTESWKTVYEAKGLANDLRAKYKAASNPPYQISDQAEQRLKREGDVDLVKKNISR